MKCVAFPIFATGCDMTTLQCSTTTDQNCMTSTTLSYLRYLLFMSTKKKGKVILLQARCDPEGG